LEIISLVRLKIEDPLNSDDAVVRFDDLATTGVDNAFDAYKFSKNGGTVDIWTTTGGADLSINAIPFPTPSVDIPVSFYTSIAGTFKISGPQIDGLQNYKVLLTDKSNNSVYDLTTTPFVSFSAPGGIITDRFLLTVGTITTALPETKTPTTSAFNIYHDKRNLNIQTLGDSWNGVRGDIRILDISGKLMQMETNTDFNKGVVKQIPVRLQNGIYFVEITSGYQRYVGKVVIR